MAGFLYAVFGRGGGASALPTAIDDGGYLCGGVLSQAVEHVVDRTYSRLRVLPDYARRLSGPVAETIRHIDELAEAVPGAIFCSRSAFSEDPRVNAFFVDPKHMQEVFSTNAEVRALLSSHPDSDECWALLCMRREERSQFGMSLVGDAVQRDVMQTSVSFTDHQVVSPGCSEADARRSLKCCVFNGLLTYIERRANAARTTSAEMENRLKALRGRMRHPVAGESAEESRARLQSQIEKLELGVAQMDLRLASLEDYLNFVADVLGNPTQYLSSTSCSIRLNRMGIKLDAGSLDTGYDVPLLEFRIAAKEPRIGALVRFPRADLLPQQDFLSRADIFLSL